MNKRFFLSSRFLVFPILRFFHHSRQVARRQLRHKPVLPCLFSEFFFFPQHQQPVCIPYFRHPFACIPIPCPRQHATHVLHEAPPALSCPALVPLHCIYHTHSFATQRARSLVPLIYHLYSLVAGFILRIEIAASHPGLTRSSTEAFPCAVQSGICVGAVLRDKILNSTLDRRSHAARAPVTVGWHPACCRGYPRPFTWLLGWNKFTTQTHTDGLVHHQEALPTTQPRRARIPCKPSVSPPFPSIS